MIPFAAHTTAQTVNAFQWAKQPQNYPQPVGISTLIQCTVAPLAYMSQPPNGISIGSAIFKQHILVTNTQTDRQTGRQAMLHMTSVAIGHIYEMCAMPSKIQKV